MRNPRADQKLASIRNLDASYEIERCGLKLQVFRNVYPTSELSELMVEVMDDALFGITDDASVLDYGSGTGFLAIQAAKRGAKVVAIDINEDAAKCGAANAERYGVEQRVDFRVCRNLEGLKFGEKFDLVFAGMPWDDEQVSDVVDMSMYDPGFTMRHALFERASDILRPGGRIIMSSMEGHDKLYPHMYDRSRFSFEIYRKRLIKQIWHYALLVLPRRNHQIQ